MRLFTEVRNNAHASGALLPRPVRRTKFHPSAVVRVISRILFVIGFCLAIFFLVLDIITYFHKPVDVGEYRSFNLWFLAGNIGGIFLIGIMQAFTTEKEKDWMERSR